MRYVSRGSLHDEILSDIGAAEVRAIARTVMKSVFILWIGKELVLKWLWKEEDSVWVGLLGRNCLCLEAGETVGKSWA